jgi:hypothetical protein
MIEEFSGGYYHTEMNVQEYDGGPVIEQGLYDFINRELYLDESAPVMMRVGFDAGPLFAVEAESAVPRDVLALPKELIGARGTSSVFVLKSEYVDTVGEYYG